MQVRTGGRWNYALHGAFPALSLAAARLDPELLGNPGRRDWLLAFSLSASPTALAPSHLLLRAGNLFALVESLSRCPKFANPRAPGAVNHVHGIAVPHP